MKKGFIKTMVVLICLVFGLVFICSGCKKKADSSAVSLTSFEGTVYAEDAAGNRKQITAGDVIESGDILVTGEGSSAAVTLAKDRTAYMDENTRMQFVREGNNLDLLVSEGRILMDVKEKLKENETLTVHTTAITADIRGTIVFVQEQPRQMAPSDSLFGVLEGAADVSYTGLNNPPAQIQAGWQTDAQYQNNQEEIQIAKVVETQITREDLGGFFAGIIQDNNLEERISIGAEISAGGDATYTGEVTLVAPSASKLYDGTPLAFPSGVKVSGLPGGFTVRATASGSQTNVGSSANLISSYTILNAQGEDVTAKFVNVTKVSGVLMVDPAPITVWTGSAEKEYDGQPLTNKEAGVLAGASVNASSDDGKMPTLSSRVCETEDALGQKEIVGFSGVTQVHATNPLTGETMATQLKAGQKLTVGLSNENQSDSLEFMISNISEMDLPETVLRFYAKNPEMLAQACLDAGWDPDLMNALIAALPPDADSQNHQELLSGSVNAQITIDPENTGAAERPLSGEEVSFTPISVDPSIKVTATGSQTEVGESKNTYSIEWGNADPDNYVLTDDLGKLVVTRKSSSNVTPAPAGSGMVPSGNQNLPSGNGNDSSGNKKEEQEPPITSAVTFESGSATKVYDGTALSDNTITVTGLPEGYTYEAACSGNITDAGSVDNTIGEIKIFDASGKDVTNRFTNITKTAGTLTVEALQLQVEWKIENTLVYAGLSYKAFAGDVTVTYLNGAHVGEIVTTDEGIEDGDSGKIVYRFDLFTGDPITVYASGEGRDVGTHSITLEAEASVDKTTDYAFSYSADSLVITPVELIVKTDNAERPYNGTPLTAAGVTISRDFDGEVLVIASDGKLLYGEDDITFTAIGTITDEGTAENGYSADWGAVNPANYSITEQLGTLKVVIISITASSAEKDYDSQPLESSGYTVANLPDGWSLADVVVSGSQTEPGEGKNQIMSYRLFDPAGDDVSGAYSNGVVCVDGTLRVKGLSDSYEVIWDSVFSRKYLKVAFPDISVTYGIQEGQYSSARGVAENVVAEIQQIMAQQENNENQNDDTGNDPDENIEVPDYTTYVIGKLQEKGLITDGGEDKGTINGENVAMFGDQLIDPDSETSDINYFITVGGAVICKDNMTIYFSSLNQSFNLKNCTYGQVRNAAESMSLQYLSDSEFQTALKSALQAKGWI